MQKLIHLDSLLFPASDVQAISNVEQEWHGDYLFFYTITVYLADCRIAKWKSDRCNKTTPDWNVGCKKQADEFRSGIINSVWPDLQIIDYTPISEGDFDD
jgi:hypothetical protein